MSKSPRPLGKVAAICAYSQEDGIILLALLVALLLPQMAGAQTETFRDASGRITGTASRDANGTVTYRDGSGRMTGTATRDANGTRTFRDGSGRTTGTATTDSNGTTTFRDASGRTTGTASGRRR